MLQIPVCVEEKGLACNDILWQCLPLAIWRYPIEGCPNMIDTLRVISNQQ